MSVDVKICGLRNEAGVKASIDFGARYVGFVLYPTSKRYIAPQAASILMSLVPERVMRVGLFVDARNDELHTALQNVQLDMLQLHGNETPERVSEVRAMTGLPVMKALRIATDEDLKPLADYEIVADRLLFDTRVGDEPTGGTGKSFDWNLLRDRRIRKPWMLAGGLKASNLAEAVRVTGALTVDVSSGVENDAGQKDAEKIRMFIDTATALA